MTARRSVITLAVIVLLSIVTCGPAEPTTTSLPPTPTPMAATPTVVPLSSSEATATADTTVRGATQEPITSPSASTIADEIEGLDNVIVHTHVCGFLIISGGQKVLIDSLFRVDNPPTPTERIRAMGEGLPPFNDIDLILVTHDHEDHFDPNLVGNNLLNNPNALLVSTDVVEQRLRDQFPEYDQIQERVIGVHLEPGEQELMSVAGLDLEIFSLSHGVPTVPNLGFSFTLGDIRLLHTGDMHPDHVTVSDLEAYGLPEKQIDIAFVSGFRLADDRFSDRILEGIQPKILVPMHFNFAKSWDNAVLSQIETDFPNVILFHGEMTWQAMDEVPALPAAIDSQGVIAFYSQRDGNAEIYLLDAGGGNLRRLTDDRAGAMAPAISPDGQQIAFTSGRDGNNEIYVINMDGSDQRRLTENRVYESHPAWSPDGSLIAFVSERDGNREIYVMDADGSNPQRLTDDPAEDMRPTWSPNGRQIAFNSNRDGNWEIYVMRSDGSDLHRLTDSPTWEIFPAWSPDGTQIAYRHSAARDWNGNIWVMDADGGNRRQLTHQPSNDENPTWSPDGSQIVFQSDRFADPGTMGSDTYNFELVVMDADGGNPRRLTDHPAGDYWPTWGPAAKAAGTTESQTPLAMATQSIPAGDASAEVSLVVDVPLGSPPILDGVLEPTEWAGAFQDKLSDGGELFLTQDGEYLYVGLRANAKGSGVGSICIDRGEHIAILHSSAALGTAIYERQGTEWQRIQDFSWRCQDTGNGAAAQKERSEFLQAEGWLASNGRMGVPEEVEYQIAMPEGSLWLAVTFLGPPGFDSVAAWPQELDDDCQNIELITGPIPEHLQFSPQTWMVVTPAEASTPGPAPISVTTAAQVEKLHSLSGHGGPIVSLRFLPDGHHLMSLGGDVSLKLWDAATGQEVRSLTGEGDAVYNAVFSPDGALLAVEGPSHAVRLWDTENGQWVHEFPGHTEFVMGLAFSLDGALLATADGRGIMKVWDVANGQALYTLSGHTSPVRALAFSSDGALLASGSVEGSQVIKLWDIASGKELRTLSGHTDNVYSVAFSPDNSRLASGSGDRTVKLWDVKSGQEMHTFRGHPDRVYSVAYSPDGTLLASGSFDGTIKLWNVETGQELHTLRGHTDLVEPLMFSSDGSLLASGSFDSTVILWGVPR